MNSTTPQDFINTLSPQDSQVFMLLWLDLLETCLRAGNSESRNSQAGALAFESRSIRGGHELAIHIEESGDRGFEGLNCTKTLFSAGDGDHDDDGGGHRYLGSKGSFVCKIEQNCGGYCDQDYDANFDIVIAHIPDKKSRMLYIQKAKDGFRQMDEDIVSGKIKNAGEKFNQVRPKEAAKMLKKLLKHHKDGGAIWDLLMKQMLKGTQKIQTKQKQSRTKKHKTPSQK